MRKMKRSCGLYQYLLERGLFDQGEEALARGKKEYRKQYLKAHKQAYRAKKSEHTISCLPVDEKTLKTAAKAHGVSVTDYIKRAALAYTHKQYLVPRLDVMHQVLQQLMYTRTQVERVRQEKKSFFTKSKDEQIEVLLQSVEQIVKRSFNTPADLETLVAEARKTNPVLAERLKNILVA